MTLEDVLARMYASEINCRIACFWDAGWDVWLGDEVNGWVEKGWVEDGHEGEIAPTLHRMIVQHFPDSDYAQQARVICPGCLKDHTELGLLAAQIVCPCGNDPFTNLQGLEFHA